MSAFPEVKILDGIGGTHTYESTGGLTKREYFAIRCMQGLMATFPEKSNTEAIIELLPQNSVTLADLLIEELNKNDCKISVETK